MNITIRPVALALLVLAAVVTALAYEVDFDSVPLGPDLYWNGSDGSGGVTHQHLVFHNVFSSQGSNWSGFAFSQVNNTNTAGYQNQYACYGGRDVSGTGVYAVVYDSAWEEADVVTFPLPSLVLGCYVNNTTYAALTMRDGDGFTEKFGGSTGDTADWFLLTIMGRDEEGNELGSVTHYLADYRFSDNAMDYIQSDWRWVDLTPLGPKVKSLHFLLTSSDNSVWGMDTPAYFAMDNLQACYAAPAGWSNSTAYDRTTNAFVAWASGWTHYVVGSSVSNQFMMPNNAVGPPSADPSDIVCLGDGGTITLTFGVPLADGPGWDFAVFENAVVDTFLELAWVEVSSDGTNFFRFPNHSLTAEAVAAFGEVYSTNVAGFAGKYALEYGTPFDLRALPRDPRLNTMDVRWVRLIDIVGDGSCTDSFGHIVYDPHPTIGSAGFDLAAVGVINFRSECRIAAISPGKVVVQWEAMTNRLYQLQSVDNLMSTNWVNLCAAITGDDQVVSMMDTNSSVECRYYRVIRMPAPTEGSSP